MTIGNGTAAALIGGSADIAFTNITAVLLAHGRGLPLQILAPSVLYNSANGTTAMVVAQDSPISTARDLNGKTLGSLTLGDNTYASNSGVDRSAWRRFAYGQSHRGSAVAGSASA